jgi:tRNA G18 (ribose-2'-O)-methylase SpoU
MRVHEIDSPDDPRIAVFRDLPSSRELRRSARFIIEGRILLERLSEGGVRAESILTDASHRPVAMANAGSETEVYVADKAVLDAIIGFRFHRGMLASALRPELAGVEQFIKQAERRSLLVICDQLADPVNLGGVIRNAAALGAAGVLIGPASADAYGRQSLRVSMGAVFKTQPLASNDLLADAALLKQHGFRIISTVLADDAVELLDCPVHERMAIVLGNEGYGLDDPWRAVSDERVTIAMASGVDSLNVSAASAVFLHHFRSRGS